MNTCWWVNKSLLKQLIFINLYFSIFNYRVLWIFTNEARGLFLSHFLLLMNRVVFFKPVWEIGSSHFEPSLNNWNLFNTVMHCYAHSKKLFKSKIWAANKFTTWTEFSFLRYFLLFSNLSGKNFLLNLSVKVKQSEKFSSFLVRILLLALKKYQINISVEACNF